MDKIYEESGVIIRSSKLEDAVYISERMRISDIEEVWSSHHHNPKEAMILSLEKSVMSFTVEVKGNPVLMFGLVAENLMGKSASIWMLGTDEIEKIKIKFLRKNRTFIDWMLSIYPVLYNHVSIKNTKSLQWLKWLGASFKNPTTYGLEQEQFQYFYFERK